MIKSSRNDILSSNDINSEIKSSYDDINSEIKSSYDDINSEIKSSYDDISSSSDINSKIINS